jgi:small subunit ribosomal protein S6
MRPYEVMVIFDADLDDETVRATVARYIQLIEGKGAKPGPVDFWGKRRFAYELKHRWEGYYVVLQTKAEPPAMDELHRVLSLADEVLRHKILRIPEQVYGKIGGPGSRPAPVVAEAPAPTPEAAPVTDEPEAVDEPTPEPAEDVEATVADA